MLFEPGIALRLVAALLLQRVFLRLSGLGTLEIDVLALVEDAIPSLVELKSKSKLRFQMLVEACAPAHSFCAKKSSIGA